MRDTWPLLEQIPFPAIRRGRLDTLQVNVGYRCNQSCVHCHVNAGPSRTEEMSGEVVDVVLAFLERRRIATLDITGGAPELNPHFRRLVGAARDMGVRVMDRCNLTILEVPGQEDLAEFLAAPAGRDRRLDALLSRGQCRSPARQGRVRWLDPRPASGSTRSATGASDSGLVLNLVYNPQGPSLPPAAGGARSRLQARARRALRHRVQPALHARQHADPALRRDPDRQGRVRPLPRPAAARASRRQSRPA